MDFLYFEVNNTNSWWVSDCRSHHIEILSLPECPPRLIRLMEVFHLAVGFRDTWYSVKRKLGVDTEWYLGLGSHHAYRIRNKLCFCSSKFYVRMATINHRRLCACDSESWARWGHSGRWPRPSQLAFTPLAKYQWWNLTVSPVSVHSSWGVAAVTYVNTVRTENSEP